MDDTLIIKEAPRGTTTEAVASGEGFPSKESLKAMPYSEFLQTPYWNEIADAIKKRDGYRCRVCNSSKQIAAHHRTYEHHGEEHLHMGDLTTLCEKCHTSFHKPVPPFEIRVSKKPKGKSGRFFRRAAIKLGIKTDKLVALGRIKVIKLLEARGLNPKGKPLKKKEREKSLLFDHGRGYRAPTKYMDYAQYQQTMQPDKSPWERALGI